MSKVIFTNGNIYTLDKKEPKAESVVVDNGRIIDLGSNNDMLMQWGTENYQIVDLQGKMVAPGLVDSHLHLSGVGFQFLDLNLEGVASKAEMIEKVREKAKSVSPGKWVIGMGWDENLFADGGIPTLEELDYAAPHCPIYLKRVCHHAFLVNSKALEAACYHSNMVIPTGGSIELDPVTQKPTGLVLESASTIFTRKIPEKTYDELKDGLRQAMRHSIKLGLTGVHTNDTSYLGGLDQTYKMYDELINIEGMDLRCNLLIDYPYLKELKERGMYAGYGNDKLQVGAVKIFADGAFGRRTALLSEEYDDAPGQFGEAMLNQEKLYHIIQEARDHSMPVAVHTIGDQALENVLNVLDQFPSVKYRDRLIHVSLVREDLIKRLASPNRVADIQPRFVVGDFPWLEDRLGSERVQYAYAWNKLLTEGALCAGGSDAPVEPVDPLLGIHAAVTRKYPSREEHEGFIPQEKLTIEEALKVFTVGGAFATNEEAKKGTITRGKLADMTIFSKDLFNLEDPDELLETKVEMTIIGGKVQHI